MQEFDPSILKNIYKPLHKTHKGQNGKLFLIGGSKLFHAASLWALTAASRVVDMVFYASTPENNELLYEAKKEFRNGIVVSRGEIESYIKEADCILIGPGMVRAKHEQVLSNKHEVLGIQEIKNLNDEGEQAYWLTKYLLDKYTHKKWVIDAGALQMMEPEWLLKLSGNVVITPHEKEFEILKSKIKNEELKNTMQNMELKEQIALFSKEYNCVVLLKQQIDTICSPVGKCVQVSGGNAGMTKGGTGDVLAGLVSALSCKNEMFLSAQVGSFINKKAAERLFKRVGFYFNSTDLVNEIPVVMKEYIID